MIEDGNIVKKKMTLKEIQEEKIYFRKIKTALQELHNDLVSAKLDVKTIVGSPKVIKYLKKHEK